MSEATSDRYDPSFWVRAQVEDLGVRLAEERTRPCPHLTDPENDRYAWALWVPERIYCADCIGPVLDMPDGPCDRCGDQPVAFQSDYRPTEAGDWVLLFRLCSTCHAKELSQ